MALTKAHNRMIDGSAVNVKDFGASQSETAANNTIALQAAINANTDGGDIEIPKGVKFNMLDLDLTANECNLIYWAEDEVDRTGPSAPGTNERIFFSSNWKQQVGTTVDVNEWRYEAPYHPGIVINAREEIPHSGTGTRQGLSSLVFKKNSYNQWQVGSGTSGFESNWWRVGSYEVRQTFPIGSSSFSVAPVVGEQLVGDTSGANGILLVVNTNDMLLSWTDGTFVAGETVTVAGTKTSTVGLPSAPTFSYNNKPFRMVVNNYGGGQGANIPPSHALNPWTVGGTLLVEDAEGGGFGSGSARVRVIDDVLSPTKGFIFEIDSTSGNIQLSNHLGSAIGHFEDLVVSDIEIADAATGGNSVVPPQDCRFRRTMEGVVHFEMFLLNINTSGLTSGNPIYVRNLPIVQKNNGNAKRIYNVIPNAVSSTAGNILGRSVQGTDYFELIDVTTSGHTALLISSISVGSGDLYISGTYYE